mgnify:CR=1 FL=1
MAETPEPSLAERIDVFLAAPGVSDATSDDLLRAAAAQLRQLDRIKAAAGDDIEWSVALAVCRELAVRYPSWASDLNLTEALLRRISDALEADDGA